MKKLLLVFSIVCIASLAFAQHNTSAMGQKRPDYPISFSHHTLKNTYIYEQDFSGTSEPAGFFAVDPADTASCPGTSGTCLIVADQWLQIGAETFTGNRAALCFYIDGAPVNACYFSGETPADGTYEQISTTQGASVSFGSHTVETIGYSDFGTFLGTANFTYRVYKP